jgi:HlyD family secretion protein
MKRLIPLLIVALAATAFYRRDRWLPQAPGQANYLGYIEGETVLIAPPLAGRLAVRAVAPGGTVRKGDPLFSLDTTAAKAEVERNEAAVAAAKARLANLLTGKRDPELEVIRAQRREAEAAFEMARKELKRATMLTGSGVAAAQRLDQAQATVAQLEARIAQFGAAEQSARMAARDAEIAAARAAIGEAKAGLAIARQKLVDLAPVAPVAGTVDETFYDAGEWVGAGQPVVALLAPDDITLLFFVTEGALATTRPGTRVRFHCDGCGEAKQATITHVAAEPEFTPPVIYSQTARAKLVFRVEARPDGFDPLLRPGLPVEVEPLP